MIFGDLEDAKNVFFIGTGDKICNRAENEFVSLGSSGTDLDLILAAFGVPGGA